MEYIIRKNGKVIKRPKWVGAPNSAFTRISEALDWGDEITVGSGSFTVESSDGSFVAERTWTGGGGSWVGKYRVLRGE